MQEVPRCSQQGKPPHHPGFHMATAQKYLGLFCKPAKRCCQPKTEHGNQNARGGRDGALKPLQMLVLLRPGCTELCLTPAPAVFSSNKQKTPIIIKVRCPAKDRAPGCQGFFRAKDKFLPRRGITTAPRQVRPWSRAGEEGGFCFCRSGSCCVSA